MKARKFSNKNLNNIKLSFYKKTQQEIELVDTLPKRHRPIFGLMAAAVVMCFTIGVWASSSVIDMSEIYQSFLGNGSESAGFSINDTFEKDGIELKLLSAVVDGNNGYIFFTVQDLTGDRLDDKLGRGWSNVDFKGFFKGYLLDCGVELLSYDEAAKTITAVSRIKSTKGISVNDKMTFTIGELESGITRYENFDTGIDLYETVSNQTDLQFTNEYSKDIGSWVAPIGTDLTEKEISKMSFLKKNALNIPIEGIDWAVVSNVGIVNNQLHIQYQYTEKRSSFNGGSFTLYDQNGEEISSSYSVGMGEYPKNYDEFIYDLNDIEQLKNLSIKADFSTSTTYIEGNWKLDFKIDSKMEEKRIETKPVESQYIKKMTIIVSPISTTVKLKVTGGGKSKTARGDDDGRYSAIMDIFEKGNYLKLKDGSIVQLEMRSGSLDHETNKGDVNYANDFFEIDDLSSIVLGGSEYFFD